jgi:phosphoglycerate dehydrogenase-like enzyme
MSKIIISGVTLNENQKSRLTSLGEIIYLPSATSSDDLLKQTEGADILYSNGAFLLESLPKFNHLFITYPYIELGVFDAEELKKKDVIIANAQGGNRPSIIEWVMFMVLELFRKFIPFVRVTENNPIQIQESLSGKKVLIVGKGSIGTKIAIPCQAFGMIVDFFVRGDNLITKAANADIVINALNCNSSSYNLLNEEFFMSLKPGSYFISFVRQYTYDLDALLKAIDQGIIAGAAIDCDPEKFGDTDNAFYQKALSNPKILVTPHIAWSTKQAVANGVEIGMQNIELFLNSKPQNILKKI